MNQDEIINLFDSIEEKMINKDTLGFAPEVLDVLDNVEAGSQEIEMIKLQISNEILMLVFSIANSAYYKNIRKGKISSFYEVVTSLGMNHVKVMIIILALKILARGDKEIEIIFIRSVVSAVFGKILSQQFGMREDNARRVELGGLFSEIGTMIILLYKKLYAAHDERIDETFIKKYHPYLAERIIEQFSLPDYLKQVVFSESIVLEDSYITISGITRLSIDFVAECFYKFHNQLVVEDHSPPVSGCDGAMSLANIIEHQFDAVGLGKYLRIIKNKERLLPEYEGRKKEQERV
ncbi:MAG: HDOD domain-containing protein [Smithella sp.]